LDWRRLGRAVVAKFTREALVSVLMLAAGKFLPALLAYLTFGRPLIEWAARALKWLLYG
jgi:hypothetical protein